MSQVQHFFDQDTSTLSYVVHDEVSRDAIIIDPVLNFSVASGRIWTQSVQDLINFVKTKQLKVRMILETHAHADHLSGSQELKRFFPEAQLAIGSRITEVQKVFAALYHLPASFPTDGQQFDRLLQAHENVAVGTLSFRVLPTPGHTPACSSYLFDQKVFTGDALFMPDYGTGRCDFPSGSAQDLYRSITEEIYTLPGETLIYTGHDYQPGGRALRYQASIEESRRENIQLKALTSLESFVRMRQERDAKLDAPKLLHPSVQVNIDAGHLPPPESNGRSYLKIPLSRG